MDEDLAERKEREEKAVDKIGENMLDFLKSDWTTNDKKILYKKIFVIIIV